MGDNEKQRTERFLDSLTYFDIDPLVAKQAGFLQRQWRKKGKTLLLPDLLLAALSLEHDFVLMTRNVKDFPMPELKVYQFLQ